jgi:hypothetical protein
MIARNYMLGVLFLFLACADLPARDKKFPWICVWLTLAANVHLMFAVIAFALFLTIALEQLQRQSIPKTSGYWCCCIRGWTGRRSGANHAVGRSAFLRPSMKCHGMKSSPKDSLRCLRAGLPCPIFAASISGIRIFLLA